MTEGRGGNTAGTLESVVPRLALKGLRHVLTLCSIGSRSSVARRLLGFRSSYIQSPLVTADRHADGRDARVSSIMHDEAGGWLFCVFL
jgi:hypothetical protein